MNSTTKQNITPELRQWIVDQAKAGRSPDDVLKSMIDSGWTEDVAIDALENTLQGFLKDHAKANGLPVPVPVPEPDLLDAPGSVVVDGHEIKIVMAMRNPRVVVFGGLMTEAECDE